MEKRKKDRGSQKCSRRRHLKQVIKDIVGFEEEEERRREEDRRTRSNGSRVDRQNFTAPIFCCDATRLVGLRFFASHREESQVVRASCVSITRQKWRRKDVRIYFAGRIKSLNISCVFVNFARSTIIVRHVERLANFIGYALGAAVH